MNQTPLHPLVTDDYHLIQDFMVTKITFLLAAQASTGEWQHEIKEMYETSSEHWGHRNGLLFDYSLARFLVAASADGYGSEVIAGGADDAFLPDFVTAVQRQDYIYARERWSETNAEAIQLDGSLLPSTVTLVLKLIQTGQRLEIAEAIHDLPPEYFPPTFAS